MVSYDMNAMVRYNLLVKNAMEVLTTLVNIWYKVFVVRRSVQERDLAAQWDRGGGLQLAR